MTTPWQKRSIALYTQKSSLEQDFHCSAVQQEAMLAYIRQRRQRGRITILELFDDGDYSTRDMDRPALQRLLRQIRNGNIDCVVVYTIESITTSLVHFTWLMAYFARHHVDFVSVTPEFDSSTPVGRLTLNILRSFSQFNHAKYTRDEMTIHSLNLSS